MKTRISRYCMTWIVQTRTPIILYVFLELWLGLGHAFYVSSRCLPRCQVSTNFKWTKMVFSVLRWLNIQQSGT